LHPLKLFSFLIADTTICCAYKTPQYGNYLKRDGDKLQVYDGYVKDKGALLQTAWKQVEEVLLRGRRIW
jgi:hypothetical protein